MKKIEVIVSIILVMVLSFIITGCAKTSEIDKFVGNWENTVDGFDYISIYKNGESTYSGMVEISFGKDGPTYSGTCTLMVGENVNKIQIQYNDGFIKDKIYTLTYEFEGNDKVILRDDENTLILEKLEESGTHEVNEEIPELKFED